MKVCIEVDGQDAQVFTQVLNEDGGFREAATHKLLQQNKAAGIERLTAFVAVLGRISKGFTEALERDNLLNLPARKREIRELARIAA